MVLAWFSGVFCLKKDMATANQFLRQEAQRSLAGKWPLAIATFLVYTIITGAFGAARGLGILGLLIAGPMALGAAHFSLALSRGNDARLEQLFDGFRLYAKALGTHLLMLLFVVLWLLLLIVPGIVAALSYSMSFFILADNPTLTPRETLRRSELMMYGYKAKLFGMCIWFFLLSILCVLTMGIGFLWLIPYAHVCMAKFYDDIKASQPGVATGPRQ